jgi:hypothetical protein
VIPEGRQKWEGQQLPKNGRSHMEIGTRLVTGYPWQVNLPLISLERAPVTAFRKKATHKASFERDPN